MHPRTLVVLAALLLPTTATAGTWIGDTTSGWAHIGGGGGLGDGLAPSAGGRAIFGVGAYTIGIYAGAELDLTFTPVLPFSVGGVGMVGVHIPFPVFHPMFGIRAGGGFAVAHGYAGPTGTVGGQIGFIVRQFDGRYGVRLNIDADAVFFRDTGGGDTNLSDDHRVFPQVMGTVAFVF